MKTISINPLYDDIELILTELFSRLRPGELIIGNRIVSELEGRGLFEGNTAKHDYKLGAISRVVRRGRASGKFMDITKINVREYTQTGDFSNKVAYSKKGVDDVKCDITE